MHTPDESSVIALITHLPDDLQEDWQERAAIMQFEAGLARDHAEALALIDLLRRYPNALSGVTVIEVQYGDATDWLLTTDIDAVQRHLISTGGKEVARPELAYVLDRQYGGMAMLAGI